MTRGARKSECAGTNWMRGDQVTDPCSKDGTVAKSNGIIAGKGGGFIGRTVVLGDRWWYRGVGDRGRKSGTDYPRPSLECHFVD